MPSPFQLQQEHAAAGARYVAAVAEFKGATVHLAAVERALANANFASPPGAGELTFSALPDPISLRHPIFAPDIGGDWASEVAAEVEQILSHYSGA